MHGSTRPRCPSHRARVARTHRDAYVQHALRAASSSAADPGAAEARKAAAMAALLAAFARLTAHRRAMGSREHACAQRPPSLTGQLDDQAHEVSVHAALMHLVEDQVRHVSKAPFRACSASALRCRRILGRRVNEPLQQPASRGERDARVSARNGVVTDAIAHSAPWRFSALICNALSKRHGCYTAWLGDIYEGSSSAPNFMRDEIGCRSTSSRSCNT